jgi:ABC-type phosphate transport system substrate-binding protein
MALLDEQIVEEWLNRQHYFTMRGIKCGVDEIDLLAIKKNKDKFECLHAEVQVSFRPIGYLGIQSAKKRTKEELQEITKDWVNKKYFQKKKVEKRNEIVNGAEWKFMFVCGNMKNEYQLDLIRSYGIEVVDYTEPLSNLLAEIKSISSSQATNILDIVRYAYTKEKTKKVLDSGKNK